ncbi:hypothetical protein SAMN04487936_112136 [Halobacillus dabanensis]|uniref:Nucleotidyltransferase family protein n=1 Tax=Halobacillus dabanensis TaxID=240302 RepID=A0A1I3Z3I1_HALDA|nr:nucleotidyltransferase family protein [Halobacillus dabanensis]SFK38622.1 hypothetical protein SAMN04487936_112136 [Halobacillus dabanensis]
MSELEKQLLSISLNWTPYIHPIFEAVDPFLENYYLGAGVITQSVWNYLHGYPPSYGIGDADIIYFDEKGTLDEEQKLEERLNKRLGDLPFSIDVTNEALVHFWYEEKFGKSISPYTSAEAAIDTWPTTASAVGVKRGRAGEFSIYAPFGLEDLFAMVVRPNKRLITEDVYRKKAEKWKARWPDLTITPW